MRMIRLALAMTAGALLVGCNNQPRLYKIALNPEPLFALPNTCFVNDVVPPEDVQVKAFQNSRLSDEWMIWDGTDSQYLELDHDQIFLVPLGDARPIAVNFLIEGDGTQFKSNLQTLQEVAATSYKEVRTQMVTATFDSLGNTAEGKLELVSNFDCSGGGCDASMRNQPGNKSCTVTVDFVGRRIDYERQDPVPQPPVQ